MYQPTFGDLEHDQKRKRAVLSTRSDQGAEC